MPRVTKAKIAKAKHKKVLASTKGHYGARSRLFKTAFRDRKNKKRSFRSLWISRINSASREFDISYSKLINGLSKNNIIIDRKILSDIAVNDVSTFEKILKTAIK